MRDLDDVERENEFLARHDAVCPACTAKESELLDSETVNQGRTVNVAWHSDVELPDQGVEPECRILADADHGITVGLAENGAPLAHVPLPTRQQTRLDLARLIAGGGWSVVPSESATNAAAMQEDLARILDALGLGDHARPYSPHECVIRDVLPAIERMTAANARHMQEIGRLRDRNQQLYSQTNQPDRPEPVDPESVRAGDQVRIEAVDGIAGIGPEWVIAGRVRERSRSVAVVEAKDVSVMTVPFRAGVWYVLPDPEPEHDPANVEALYQVLYESHNGGGTGEPPDVRWCETYKHLALKLDRHNVRVVSTDA